MGRQGCHSSAEWNPVKKTSTYQTGTIDRGGRKPHAKKDGSAFERNLRQALSQNFRYGGKDRERKKKDSKSRVELQSAGFISV